MDGPPTLTRVHNVTTTNLHQNAERQLLWFTIVVRWVFPNEWRLAPSRSQQRYTVGRTSFHMSRSAGRWNPPSVKIRYEIYWKCFSNFYSIGNAKLLIFPRLWQPIVWLLKKSLNYFIHYSRRINSLQVERTGKIHRDFGYYIGSPL